jgi:hypothetical protein
LASRASSRKRSLSAAAIEDEKEAAHENDLSEEEKETAAGQLFDKKDESFEEGSTAASIVSE